MNNKIVKYLDSGWEDKDFEKKLQEKIDEAFREGLTYYDIKISSKGNHCMIIFQYGQEN
jgi:hypothetical protein